MKTAFTGSLLVSAFGLLAPRLLQAQGIVTFLSNLGEPSIGSVSSLGASFTAGGNVGGYALSSIQVAMTDASGSPKGFTLTLYVVTDPYSGDLASLGTLDGPTDPVIGGTYTYTPSSSLILSPYGSYDFIGTWSGNGAYEWSVTGKLSSDAIGGWDGSGFDNYSIASEFGQYSITATDVPEPSAEMLLGGGGILLLGFARWKAKRRS